MKESVKFFENQQFGKIRIAGTSEEPLFCLADVCRVLEIQASVTKKRLKQDGINLIKVISPFFIKGINKSVCTNEQY